jgi:hypothetical protein
LPRREFREQNGRRDVGNASQAPARIVPVAKREQALDEINKKLDEYEQIANWLLFGKSRGAR